MPVSSVLWYAPVRGGQVLTDLKVSHPADVLVSQMNNVPKLPGEGTMAFAGRLSRKAGFMGLWTGLGPRIIMVGTLTSLQWLVYDGWKAYLGLYVCLLTANLIE